jgi:hypothetical protein
MPVFKCGIFRLFLVMCVNFFDTYFQFIPKKTAELAKNSPVVACKSLAQIWHRIQSSAGGYIYVQRESGVPWRECLPT